MAQIGQARRCSVLPGRVLAYAQAESPAAGAVAPLTSGHGRSGMVLRGCGAASQVRGLRAVGDQQTLVVDVAAWATKDATPSKPLALPQGDALFHVGLDEWAHGHVRAGADAVLSPSLFVRADDWESARAVVRAGREKTRPDVWTLLATDAAALDPARLPALLDVVGEESAGHPMAFVFAGTGDPLAVGHRAAGLRALLAALPGSLIVGVDVLMGTDVAAHGGTAAIGATGSLRRPSRPGDTGRGFANGFAPGAFLRDLWELRSPDTYADWYANSPSPVCQECDGRAVDSFTGSPADKARVFAHNAHAWLDVADEISRRQPHAARQWLDAERRRGFEAHLALTGTGTALAADRLLRRLCELDDPHHRRALPTGAWL